MEFKFLKLRDLQGKTPSFPAAGEVHIIYVPEPDDSNLHKAGAGRAMIREILSYYLCIDKGLVCLHESRHGKPYLASPAIGRNLYFKIQLNYFRFVFVKHIAYLCTIRHKKHHISNYIA